VTLAFINPNIQPEIEYHLRLDTLSAFAGTQSVPVLAGDYQPDIWEKTVAIHGGPYPLIAGDPYEQANRLQREQRCRACYRLRFEATAALAAAHGFETIATTLSISPYQFTKVLLEELRRAAERLGLRALAEDYRQFYPQATQRSRELGMYRQNFCGCRLSLLEAEAERAARRAARSQEAVSVLDRHADS
jgi:predicted adenine nucleotide alpha hydrolase (AANH) superfamily ATPase